MNAKTQGDHVRTLSPCIMRSDIQNDGQNHRVALHLFHNVAMELVLDAILQCRPVFAAEVAVGKNAPHHVTAALDDVFVFPAVDEAAADEVGAGDQAAVIPAVAEQVQKGHDFFVAVAVLPETGFLLPEITGAAADAVQLGQHGQIQIRFVMPHPEFIDQLLLVGVVQLTLHGLVFLPLELGGLFPLEQGRNCLAQTGTAGALDQRMAHVEQLIAVAAGLLIAKAHGFQAVPGFLTPVDGKIVGTGGELDVGGLAFLIQIHHPILSDLLNLIDGNFSHKASPLTIIAQFSPESKCFSPTDKPKSSQPCRERL